MHQNCGCQRITVPIYGTTESAFRYERDPTCPNRDELPLHWRKLQDGRRLTAAEMQGVEINLEREASGVSTRR